jgi:SSS family solute:Na+ symporter
MERIVGIGGANSISLIAFTAYLLLVLGIGAYATRRSSGDINEFFIGGRRMHRLVVALSAVVSGRSAWLLLAVTGMAYTRGVSAVWTVTGYIIAELLLFVFYAPRLRRFAEAHDCVTLPDFFAARFGDRDGRLRVLLSAVILFFMLGYVAAQFVAGGKAFAGSFGIPESYGTLITAAIVLGYTVLGGFLAVSLTDVVQAFFMLVSLVVLPLLIFGDQGGAGTTIEVLRALDPGMLDPFALSVGVAIGFLGIGLGSPGNPHIIVRYLSIDDPRELRYSAVVGTIWNVAVAWGAILTGLAGRAVFADVGMLPGADPEQLFPVLAQRFLPPALFGIALASIFAALMSTADSQLLVAASVVVRDVYEKVLRRGRAVAPRRLVRYSRGVVVLLVLLALGLGWAAERVIFWLVLFAWAGLGAALGPTSILALFWRRTTRAGVAAGVVAGAATTIVWYFVDVLKNHLYELVPAFVAASVVTWAVSRRTDPPVDADSMLAAMKAPRGRRGE